MNETLPALRRKAMTLPLLPGVYLMQDGKGKIIYVGKAKALKNRVSQYFGSPHGHDEKVRAMVEQVRAFDYIVVGSEFEALVLECSLIKQHTPKYNILLKDDKGYHYIRISGGDWPRLEAALQKLDEPGARYLGPYTSGFAVKNAVEEAQHIFRLPTCTRQFPRDIGRGRPCLQFHIGLCAAPCSGKIPREVYRESVRDAVQFIQGGSAALLGQLRDRMEAAAEALEFEAAARQRDRIRAIEALKERQYVVSVSVEEQDVFALAAEQSQACFMVLRFSEGRLKDSAHFFLERPEDLPEARRELLERFYTMRNDHFPRRVLLDGETADRALLEEWLGSLAGHKVPIQVPQKGEPLRLTQLCQTNALEQLAHRTGRKSRTIAALEELARLLGLPAPPEVIEAYDISHTAGSDNVAGMVVFEHGLPKKTDYKRFSIKGFAGQDDYASLAEILTRRFARYETEKESGRGFGRLPDLILLDGGIGQIHAVQPVLRQYGLEIPLFGMVKDSRHRTRAIAANADAANADTATDDTADGQGREIALQPTRQAFALVTAIQDEVHRFAVTYHQKKRKQSALHSVLTDIPGIGGNRAAALLRQFKTVKAIRAASEAELAAAPGMNKSAAKAVKEALGEAGGNPGAESQAELQIES
ncbi:MAG: excinuclease ABC subunit UvrC [Oscillospiraceae bacterium]|jgi:excinuclease ABC subunit C|nr:excinuclease ABC subunit UvrC [Oscillospiraceae bacterium]